MYYYENSSDLTDCLKGTWGHSQVPGPHFENQCSILWANCLVLCGGQKVSQWQGCLLDLQAVEAPWVGPPGGWGVEIVE